MPTYTQDVLASLSQIFPGVQQIPLDRIRPNPDNPGPPITEDLITDLAANLEEVGLQNPIKVMPDPADPLAEGVRSDPENPKLKAGGQPWGPGDFNWVILAGERRWRAFGSLKRNSIPAFILNPSPEEAVQVTHLDNDVRQRGWWADYQSIEALLKANPNLTQVQAAAKLKLDRPKVNRALQLLPLLNPEARVLVCSNATVQNKGNWQLGEKAASCLADLEDPQAVEKALARVVDDQMTESQARALVAAMKAGTSAQAYVTAQPKPRTSRTAHPANSPLESPQPKRGPQPEASAQGASSPMEPAHPKQGPRHEASVQGPDLHSQVGNLIATHELGKRLHMPAETLNRIFPWLGRLFQRVRDFFINIGIKNQTLATILTLTVFLFIGSSLIGTTSRLVKWIFERIYYSQFSTTTREQNSPQNLAPVGQYPQSPEGEIGKQPIREKAQSSNSTVALKGPREKSPQSTAQASAKTEPVSSPQTIPAWAQDEIPVAGDFANRFYGISYSNWGDTLDYLKAQITGNDAQAMIDRYFPPSLENEMQTKMLAQYFTVGQPPKVVRGEGDSAEILARGTVTTVSRTGRNPQTLSTKPVALLLGFRHAEGIGSKIDKVMEVDPGTVGDNGQTEDLGKSVDGAVRDFRNAANTADETTSAVDKAKSLLGF